jgi:hypothetical protein
LTKKDLTKAKKQREKTIEVIAKKLWEENGKLEGTKDYYRQKAEKEYKEHQKQVLLWKLNTPFRLLSQIPELLTNTDNETRTYGLDVLKTFISGITVIGTFIAGIALYLTYQDNLEDRKLTQERLVTDRYVKAAELLKEEDVTVRVAGIYSFERIANDSPKDHWTIIQLLSSYIREKSPYYSQEKKEDKELSFDIQAAIKVIKDRDSEKDCYKKEETIWQVFLKLLSKEEKCSNFLDLRGSNLFLANLQGAYLYGANFSNANLYGVNLSDANLYSVNLYVANLYGANFSNANLYGANLYGANLYGVNLSNANLEYADLTYANLSGADLSDANLIYTNLRGANLRGANLTNVRNSSNKQIKFACNWEKAYFASSWDEEEKEWITDEEKQKAKINELKEDKASYPREAEGGGRDCGIWGE